jgi:multiple sugar transport system permease protein
MAVTTQPSRRQVSDRRLVQFFIIPTLILLILMNVFPLIFSLFVSFTNYKARSGVSPVWVGLENYKDVLSSELVWHSFAFTGRYALISVSLQMLVGFGLAMLLKEKFKGSGLLTTLILIPMMLSPAVIGQFWEGIFNPLTGPFNYIFGFSDPNTAPRWTADHRYAIWAIIIADVWMWSPFVMLLALAGLSAIPDYLYEAASIDRASAWFQFRRITLPQVMPLLLIALLFRTIEALKQFDLVMGLTSGLPSVALDTTPPVSAYATETVSVHLFRLAGPQQDLMGKVSAMGYIVLIAIIAISNIYIRALNRIRES